jgi:hypothetical protein
MEGINIENFRSVIRKKFYEKIQDETTSVNLEKAIYNYTINEANLRKIVKNGIILCFSNSIQIDCFQYILI